MNIPFLLSTTEIVIICIAAAVVLLTIIICLVLFFKSISAKKKVIDAEARFNAANNFLTVELLNQLKRIQSISKLNEEFEQIYTSKNNTYKSIVKHEHSIAKNAIKDLKDLLLDKKYDEISITIEGVSVALRNLEAKNNELKVSLSKIIDEDEANHQEIVKNRHYFLSVKDKYEAKKGELKYVEDSYEKLFKKIELEFIEADRLLKSAKYEEASKNFPDIIRVLDVLNKNIEVLPKLVSTAYIVIPKAIKDLEERYESLIKEGYPLYHIRLNHNIEQINDLLNAQKEKLSNYKVKNVDEELLSIRERLVNITVSIDDEINAKKYFTESYNKIYSSAKQVSDNFLRLRRAIPLYKDTYLLKDSYLDILQEVQNDINDLDRVKRNVDLHVHSPSPQPYTLLASKLEELDKTTSNIQEKIEEVRDYLNSLKTRTENAYQFISNTYIDLKRKQSMVRNLDIKEFSRIVNSNFTISFELLKRASEIIVQTPIDIDTIQTIIDEINENKNVLESKIKDLQNTVDMAEEIVVRANAHRNFLDFQNEIEVAEKSFFEADFTRTIDEAGKLIKRMKSKLDE